MLRGSAQTRSTLGSTSSIESSLLSSCACARELAAAAAAISDNDTETLEYLHPRPMPALALVIFARGRDPLNAGSTILARRIPTLMAHAARLRLGGRPWR